jgi:hypothetical protein
MEGVGDGRAHTLGVVQHLVVPEPQHAVPLGFEEPRAACFVLGRGIMLLAIDLDDQSCCVADEVGNESADRNLSAKPIAFGLPRPQHLPEPLFGFGHVTMAVPSALARTGAWRFLHHGSVLGITPTPTLPFKGEGIKGSSLIEGESVTDGPLVERLVALGSAFGKLTLQIGYEPLGIG